MKIFSGNMKISTPCKGYFLRWYYNGWNYWFFLPGDHTLNTEGENYRTIGTRKVSIGSGQITLEQCEAIRTIINTREVYLFTDDGWKNIRIDPTSIQVFNNQVNGYEIELQMTLGSKETKYSPVKEIPKAHVYPTGVFVIVTTIDSVFTITFSGICDISINWGDGSAPEVVSLLFGVPQVITHDYTGTGLAENVIYIDNPECITSITAPNDEIIEITIPPEAVNLTELIIPGNLLTEIPIIPPSVPLVILDMDTNPVRICQVVIGTQVWMCKNYDSDFPGSKVYNNNEANRAEYGGLYTYDQINNVDFCPYGWHVPTDAEWDSLMIYLGGADGGKLKEIGTTHWNSPNTGAIDSYGFALRSTGFYRFKIFGEFPNNIYDAINVAANLWMINEYDRENSYAVQAYYFNAELVYTLFDPNYYFGVRLIRNWASPPIAPIKIVSTLTGTFYLYLKGTRIVVIDWGDGSAIEEYNLDIEGSLSLNHSLVGGSTILVTGSQYITYISSSDSNITSVSGLGSCTDLETCQFSNNLLTVFDTYEWTKLVHLDLSFNQLTTLTTHATWVNLYHLGLSDNQLISLETHAEWVLLYNLVLYGNEFTSLETHAEWTAMHYFNVSMNSLISLVLHAEWVNIYYIHCYENNITSLTTYATWTLLNQLHINNNPILSLVTHTEWVNIASIYASDTLLTSLVCHIEWAEIWDIRAERTPLTTFVIYTTNNKIYQLRLDGCAITSAIDINNILVAIDGQVRATYSNYVIIRTHGGTNAAPTGAGITAKNSIISKGGVISTN